MEVPKLNKEVYLLAIKAIVFLYIIMSPFINHDTYLRPLNNIFVKIILLVLIIATAFIDFQMAILLTIALFVLIINFNTHDLSKAQKQVNIPTYIPAEQSIQQQMVSIPQAVPVTTPKETNSKNSEESEVIQPYTADTMHIFPDASCNTVPFESTELSGNLLSYYIDPKVKPYEVYIRMITNEENLQKAQTNLISQL